MRTTLIFGLLTASLALPRWAAADCGALPAGRGQKANIPIVFNADLDVALDDAPSTVTDRINAFSQVVAAWNTAIKAAGGVAQFTPSSTNTFQGGGPPAIRKSFGVLPVMKVCNDTNAAGPMVFSESFGNADGANLVSTGFNVASAAGLNPGPGWLVSTGLGFAADAGVDAAPQNGGGVFAFSETLGETFPFVGGESDVGWLTHQSPVGQVCPRIPWDYTNAAAVVAGKYDFYSVMLHELGHVLGLNHFTDPTNVNNVMQPALATGTRLTIGAAEGACLTKIYQPVFVAAPALGDETSGVTWLWCTPMAVGFMAIMWHFRRRAA